METVRLLRIAAALVVGTGIAAAQDDNDVPLNNGANVLFLFSDPSSGAPVGTFPPDLNGDHFWKVYPREVLQCAFGSIVVAGMWETYFDTDWTTPDPFYDRVLGNAYELSAVGGTPGCARVPSWVALGGLDGSEVHVSFGTAGLPPPCTVGATCTPGGCQPTGFLVGYTIAWSGLSIPLVCDGLQDHALSYFLPGGMTTSATGPTGFCGAGDYVFQTDWSTNESQADCCGDGVSPYSGLALAGAFFVDPLNLGPKPHLAFEDVVLNLVARTDVAGGMETGRNAGGALNALCLDTSSDEALLSTEIRDAATAVAGTPSLALTGFSLTRFAAPGVTVLGGQLMIAPSGLLNLTIAVGSLVLVPTAAGTLEGVFDGPDLPVPAGTVGTLHAQGFVLDVTTSSAQETQAWSVEVQ